MLGVLASLPLGSEGILDARLPAAIAPTLYARYGDSALILFFIVGAIIVTRRRLAR